MSIVNDTYENQKRLKINEGICMIPDNHFKFFKHIVKF